MTYQFDGFLCSVFSAERDEGVASVQAAERVHHQAKVPDRTGLLKQRDQLVFKQVSWDLANKYLPGRKRYDSIIGRIGRKLLLNWRVSCQVLAVSHQCNRDYYRNDKKGHHLDTRKRRL